jgi:signal transduction histidine kinase
MVLPRRSNAAARSVRIAVGLGVDVQEVLEVLRRMEMLSEFTPEQLRWVADHGVVVDIPAGQTAISAGDADAGFWLLMDGRASVSRPDDDGREVPTGSTDYVGAWGGRIPLTGEPSPITMRAETDARFLRLSDDDADTMLAGGMPLGRHLIAGIQMGTRRFEARLRERERLASLGRMSAGLSHELNNPAAAIARAAAQLRAAILDWHRLSMKLRLSPETKQLISAAGEELTTRSGNSDSLSGLARADAEEEIADWLELRDVSEAWDAAPVLTEAGADVAWLDDYLGGVPAEELAAAVSVLTSSATTTQLTLEIEQASARISALVSSVKTYTNMDGSGLQDTDVRKGLKSTLTMLSHKLKHYKVTVDWPPEIPTVPANSGELNQVWTNLLDNAADALAERADPGSGEVSVSVASDDEAVVVRIADNGPGMTPEIASKIFDPFFTTKAVGSGTGMGLDFVWRIVTNAHHGRVAVESEPGTGTTFVVELPRRAAAG